MKRSLMDGFLSALLPKRLSLGTNQEIDLVTRTCAVRPKAGFFSVNQGPTDSPSFSHGWPTQLPADLQELYKWLSHFSRH